MKYSLTFVALVWGYLSACVFFFLFGLVEDHRILELLTSLFWAGLYGIPLGFLSFAPFFRCISSDSGFWRYYIAPVFGGVIGWTILMLLLRELGMTVPFGGFAFVMGFATFLRGAVCHNRHRRTHALETTGHNKSAHRTG